METVQFVLDYMQQYSPVAHSVDPLLFDTNARNNAAATPLELAALEGTLPHITSCSCVSSDYLQHPAVYSV